MKIEIERIIRDLNLKLNQPIYFVVDLKTNKAIITKLSGLCWIANKKCLDIGYIDTKDIDSLEHDITNELEAVSISVQYLKISEKITYEDINLCNSLEEFLGE